MKLKLSDWAHLAEVVGVIALVISITFVGVQMRVNSQLTKAELVTQYADKWTELLFLFSTEPKFSEIMRKAEEGESFASLSEEEFLAAEAVWRGAFNTLFAQYTNYRLGLIDPDTWSQAWEPFTRTGLSYPMAIDWWYERAVPTNSYSPEFRQLIESRIAESD